MVLILSSVALSGAAAPKIELGMKEAKLLKLMGPPEEKITIPNPTGDPVIMYAWADIRVMVKDGRVDRTRPVDPRKKEQRQQREAEEKRLQEEKREAAGIVKQRRIAALENEIRRMESLLAPAPDRAATSEDEKILLRSGIEKARQEIEKLRKL